MHFLSSNSEALKKTHNTYLNQQQQQQRRPFNGLWSGTTRVGRYQKEPSPTHTYPNQRASFIIFLTLTMEKIVPCSYPFFFNHLTPDVKGHYFLQQAF